MFERAVPRGIKPVNVAPVIDVGPGTMKSSAVSISINAPFAGRLASPALPSGAPVVNTNGVAEAVPDSKANAVTAAHAVRGRNILSSSAAVFYTVLAVPEAPYCMRQHQRRQYAVVYS